MNQFNNIDDAALDQVTGGGIIGDLLETPIAKADEVLSAAEGVLGDAVDLFKSVFGRIGGLLGLN